MSDDKLILYKKFYEKFYEHTTDTHLPFINGHDLDNYFFNYIIENKIITKRTFIPIKWVSIRSFARGENIQKIINDFVTSNPNSNGFFSVSISDNGTELYTLPSNTLRFGAGEGDVIIPHLYEDRQNKLKSYIPKNFHNKKILCSFVGVNSNTVRQKIYDNFKDNKNFVVNITYGKWVKKISNECADIFIDTTLNSKFAFAPRGVARNSFRFYEVLLLGSIPVYVWDDIEWLPYKELIDYKKICISININDISKLEKILSDITENQYNQMLNEYNKIKHLFELKGMTEYIINISNK
jgi:hypothetical protein